MQHVYRPHPSRHAHPQHAHVEVQHVAEAHQKEPAAHALPHPRIAARRHVVAQQDVHEHHARNGEKERSRKAAKEDPRGVAGRRRAEGRIQHGIYEVPLQHHHDGNGAQDVKKLQASGRSVGRRRRKERAHGAEFGGGSRPQRTGKHGGVQEGPPRPGQSHA